METKFLESKIAVKNDLFLYLSKSIIEKPKGIVIIVHGLCEHSGRYDYVTKCLNSAGYCVYRFDNRGHGRSGGDRGYIDDFSEFIDDAKEVLNLAGRENIGIPVFMLGHSLGGFIAAALAVKYPDGLAGQVLSGAATIIQPLLAALEGADFSAVGRDPIANALSDIVSRDPAIVQNYKNDPLNLKEFSTKLMSEALIRGARWLMENMSAYNHPCLILHGGADEIVLPSSSQYFFEHISSSDKDLKIYGGLYHEILNEPEKDIVINDIIRWLDKRI